MLKKECNIDIINVHKSNYGWKFLVNAKIDGSLLTFVYLYASKKESERKGNRTHHKAKITNNL